MEANMGRRSSWLLLLCINFIFIAEPAIFHARAAGHLRNANVSFDLYRDYLIVLQARVGPLKGLNFLLDTGATPSVIDPHIAAKLHLEAVPTDIAVLQGTTRGATATVPSLQIGPVVKENLPVLVEDLSFVQKVVPVHLDGIVGLDVLGQAAFTISYREHEIEFGPATALATSVPLVSSQGLAMITAIVNHQPVQLLLDTGAPSLILFKREAAPGIKTAALDVLSNSIGDYDHRPLRLSSLDLGSASFSQSVAYFAPSPGDAGHDFDGLMSPAALGITRIAIDLGRGEMSFSRSR
jgi:predicted aspartyl protease